MLRTLERLAATEPPHLYSPECVEGQSSEVRAEGVLGSSERRLPHTSLLHLCRTRGRGARLWLGDARPPSRRSTSRISRRKRRLAPVRCRNSCSTSGPRYRSILDVRDVISLLSARFVGCPCPGPLRMSLLRGARSYAPRPPATGLGLPFRNNLAKVLRPLAGWTDRTGVERASSEVRPEADTARGGKPRGRPPGRASGPGHPPRRSPTAPTAGRTIARPLSATASASCDFRTKRSSPFGGPAASCGERPVGFAPPPRGGFAFSWTPG
jgi:hypothetical protein